jgi:hypothetical protein
MNGVNLMVVALAGWINQQQEEVIDTTTGMPHETDDSNFWTLRPASTKLGAPPQES